MTKALPGIYLLQQPYACASKCASGSLIIMVWSADNIRRRILLCVAFFAPGQSGVCLLYSSGAGQAALVPDVVLCYAIAVFAPPIVLSSKLMVVSHLLDCLTMPSVGN